MSFRSYEGRMSALPESCWGADVCPGQGEVLGPGQAVTAPHVAEGGDIPPLPDIGSPRFFWLAIDTFIRDYIDFITGM